MQILIAPNAFKGSIGAADAAAEVARGVHRVISHARLDLMPISDGGDGLMEVLLERFGGRTVACRVIGPLGKSHRAAYAMLKDNKTVVIEMARASGIAGLRREDLDPLHATSYGTGQLISDAVRRGTRRILVGMGGSATNDGGAGMAEALGVRFLDAAGRSLPHGVAALERLARVDISGIDLRLSDVSVTAVSDVRNPLLGPLGSARVYGPQKGATPAMVRVMERGLSRYAQVLKKDLGADISRAPGAGAAGGLGAGLIAFLNAKVVSGADWVLDQLQADRRIRRADWVVTGEGRFDRQSFFGKAPATLAHRAKSMNVPVALVCGSIESEITRRLRPLGIRKMYSMTQSGENPAQAMKRVRYRLREAGRQIARELSLALFVFLGITLFDVAHAQSASLAASTQTPAPGGSVRTRREGSDLRLDSGVSAEFAQADEWYWHRHLGDNLQKSVEWLRNFADRNPDDSRVLWRLGRSLTRHGERQAKRKDKLRFFYEAEKLLKKSIVMEPNEPEAHYWLGIAMGRIGQARGVLRSLFLVSPIRLEMRKTLDLNARHGGAHLVLGEMLRQIPGFAGGSKKEAVKELEKALELEPDYTILYPALARAYQDVGAPDKAKAVLHHFFDVKSPKDPGGYDENHRDVLELMEQLGEKIPNLN